MSTTTANLGLFKYDITTDSAVPFNIDTALNDNWNKIDAGCVNKAGDTMTGSLKINSSEYTSLCLKNENITPSGQTYRDLQFTDANGNRIGTIRNAINFDENGNAISTGIQIGTNKLDSSAPDGIQILYDETNGVTTKAPNPPASSNNQNIATTSWVNSKISGSSGNYVSKSGDTMSGNLIIEKSAPILRLKSTDFTFSSIASLSTSYNVYVPVYTSDNVSIGGLQTHTEKEKNRTSLQVRKCGDTETSNSSLPRISIEANATNVWTYAPYSDEINSIVTTRGLNKVKNGYCKLGNGIILQWGVVSTSSDTDTTIDFPISFSSASSYGVTKNMGKSDGNGVAARWMGVWNCSATGFKTGSLGNTYYQKWIAIGY